MNSSESKSLDLRDQRGFARLIAAVSSMPKMKSIAIIPARIASTRLPRKPLREIAGRPMIQRVYEAAKACQGLSDVIIATDSEEILSLAAHHGWKARMTSADCRSGTDRVREVAQAVDADVYVNVQGDEPLARS